MRGSHGSSDTCSAATSTHGSSPSSRSSSTPQAVRTVTLVRALAEHTRTATADDTARAWAVEYRQTANTSTLAHDGDARSTVGDYRNVIEHDLIPQFGADTAIESIDTGAVDASRTCWWRACRTGRRRRCWSSCTG